jgi:hypothetical protein
VQTAGFFAHPTLNGGCLARRTHRQPGGLIEIKAPNTATHLWYELSKLVPRAYRAQVTHHCG